MIVFEYLKLFYYLLRPKTVFLRRTSYAVGDNILLTVLLPHLKEKYPQHKIIVETPKVELFKNNPYADWVTKLHFKTTTKFIKPKYKVLPETKASLTRQMLSHIGIDKDSTPELYLSDQEIENAKNIYPSEYVAIAPTGKTKFSANRKEWGFDNFQKIVNSFPEIKFVQIGISSEPLLENVVDARNLSLRDTAALLYNSLFFLGLEGGFMHMSKAVGKTSIIIFGGYIKPEISGYKDDENIYSPVDCSPCFDSHNKKIECDSMICMKNISVELVVEKIKNKTNELK